MKVDWCDKRKLLFKDLTYWRKGKKTIKWSCCEILTQYKHLSPKRKINPYQNINRTLQTCPINHTKHSRRRRQHTAVWLTQPYPIKCLVRKAFLKCYIWKRIKKIEIMKSWILILMYKNEINLQKGVHFLDVGPGPIRKPDFSC